MSNAIYKKDLHDVALAVAQGSKDYTDKVRDSLRWEFGTYDLSVETINGTTMLLPTPANTIQATMDKIYGASEVSENLYIPTLQTTTLNGLTITRNGDGSYTINGTASANTNFDLISASDGWQIPIGTYYYKIFESGTATGTFYCNVRYTDNSNALTINRPTETTTGIINNSNFYAISGATFNNFVIKPMLVKGSTAPTEFKEGYTGIHNLELSGLKVEGANLFDNANTTLVNSTFNASNQTLFSYGGFALKVFNLTIGQTYTISTVKNIYVGETNNVNNSGTTRQVGGGYSYTFTATTNYLLITNQLANEYEEIFENLMINLGSTVLPYTPYIAPTTLPIDLTSIEDSGGNKLFADGSLKGVGNVADEITPYKAIKRFGIVDLGTLTYQKASTSGRDGWFQTSSLIGIIKNAITNGTKVIALSDLYTVDTVNNVYNLTTNLTLGVATTGHVQFYNTSYTEPSAFKTAMSGVYLVYELATPIEADIDFSQLVKFEAYSNGSITLVNTNNQDTTSTFKYLKEVAK